MLVSLIFKTPDAKKKRFRQWKAASQHISGCHKMTLGLQNYADIMQIAKKLYQTSE
jgi:hypothetical protein